VAKGEFLGEFEQLVLLALLRLGDQAYGMAVRREIEARAARDVSIGAVYATLDRLEEKGLVKSKLGEPSEARGGRAKKCFNITGTGARALERSQQALRHMLEGLPARWNPAR
jgi:PadR family transcriptional regulator, regulatory protein PadR